MIFSCRISFFPNDRKFYFSCLLFIGGITEEFAQLETTNHQLTEQSAQLEKKNHQLNADLSQLQEEQSTLQAEKSELQTAIDSLTQQIYSLKSGSHHDETTSAIPEPITKPLTQEQAIQTESDHHSSPLSTHSTGSDHHSSPLSTHSTGSEKSIEGLITLSQQLYASNLELQNKITQLEQQLAHSQHAYASLHFIHDQNLLLLNQMMTDKHLAERQLDRLYQQFTAVGIALHSDGTLSKISPDRPRSHRTASPRINDPATREESHKPSSPTSKAQESTQPSPLKLNPTATAFSPMSSSRSIPSPEPTSP